jgi:ribose transport system permease protein
MGAQAESSNITADVAAESRIIRETSRDMWLRRMKVLAPLWTLVAMWIFFSLATPSFATPANFNNILARIAVPAILGVGMTFVLLTGEIDLSVAAVMGLSAQIATQLHAVQKLPEPIPLVGGLLTGVLCGVGSGLISTVIRVPTFMATLAMQLIAQGLLLWISQGRSFYTESLSPLIIWIGSEKLFGDNGLRSGVMILLSTICLLVGYLVLRYTRYGRYVYMSGANPSAARLAGVNTKLMVFSVLTISGFTAGLAGLVATGRLGSAGSAPEPSYLIDAIAVVVLGGTALTGGRGGMWQTALGLLIYGSLSNGLDNIAQIPGLAKTLITGIVLLAALVVNILFAGRADRDRT